MMCTLDCGEGTTRHQHRNQIPPLSRREQRAKSGYGSQAMSRDDALVWMLRCSEDDAGWVLRSIAHARPHPFAQLHANELLLDMEERHFEEPREKKAAHTDVFAKLEPELLTETSVLSWMLQAEEQAVSHIMTCLSEEREKMFDQIVHDIELQKGGPREGREVDRLMTSLTSAAVSRTCSSPPSVHSVPPYPNLESVRSVRTDKTKHTYQEYETALPKVGLTSMAYFSHEGDEECLIEVMRLGNLDTTSHVSFGTKDWSAKAGKIYGQTFGELIFAPGEDLKEIRVPIYDDDCWHTTLEFIIELHEDGIKNCSLDHYLSSAKVKVIDNDAFPTNKYKEAILATLNVAEAADTNIKEAPFIGLFIQYVKMNLQNATVRIGTRKTLVLDQLHNVNFVLKLFMDVYLVDFILQAPADELLFIKDKYNSLLLLAALVLVPFVMLWILDQRRFSWKVAGMSRTTLQSSLLRKFLNYDNASRHGESKGDLLMAITRDSEKLVKDGFLNCLDLQKQMGKIIAVIIFQLTAPIAFDKPFRPISITLPTVTFPILMMSFLICRRKKTTSSFLAMNDAQDDQVDFFDRTVENYRLIADYSARSRVVDSFEVLIKTFNRSATEAGHILFNNLYFPKFLTLTIICIYIIFAGMSLIAGDVTLGMFLAEVSVYGQMGEAWGASYKILLEITTCSSALRRIVRLENLPTDLNTRARVAGNNQIRTGALRLEKKAMATKNLMAIDLMPIEINGLHLSGKNSSNLMGRLCLDQGQLIALVGNRGQGKATLLKVIGGVILPVSNLGDTRFFMPSHLRVLHVSLEPMFVSGSLYDNMVFGATKHTHDGSIERVEAICKLLDLNEESIRLLHSGEVRADWSSSLSQTQRMLCNLARAFIANPEVMCLHKPTQAFDEKMSLQVMKCLDDHVHKKGLCMPGHSEWERRPRTCIFTSSEWMNVGLADKVIHISGAHGIREMDKKDVTKEMLC